jgi:arylsulfatase A-like enzyme
MDAPLRPENYKDYQSRTNRYQNRYKGKDTAQEDDTGFRTLKAAYYANISLIDYCIGRVIDALGDERDNTLIIFTCDHGDIMGDYGCVGKRCMLEAAIRIPMIISWPGIVPEGKTSRTPVTLLDIHPTVMDALDEEGDLRSSEGGSLLSGASSDDSDGERFVFSQFSSGWCGQYGVNDGQYKYMYSAPDDTEWFFKLSDTLEERENLLDNPDVHDKKDKLKNALMKRHDPAQDSWSDAVENGGWKKHTPPPEDYLDDPTYGYIGLRGEDELQAEIDKLGPYARKITGIQRGNLHHDHGVCGGKPPFEKT